MSVFTLFISTLFIRNTNLLYFMGIHSVKWLFLKALNNILFIRNSKLCTLREFIDSFYSFLFLRIRKHLLLYSASILNKH